MLGSVSCGRAHFSVGARAGGMFHGSNSSTIRFTGWSYDSCSIVGCAGYRASVCLAELGRLDRFGIIDAGALATARASRTQRTEVIAPEGRRAVPLERRVVDPMRHVVQCSASTSSSAASAVSGRPLLNRRQSTPGSASLLQPELESSIMAGLRLSLLA